jgi:hypothetical protein
MAEDAPPPIDFWTVLDEAESTVETWPDWQQRVEADVYYERDIQSLPPLSGKA